MPIKVGIINSHIYKPLYAKLDEIKEEFGLEVYFLEEEKILDLFRTRRLDLALLSPLGYTKGIKTSDFRIIPTYALSAVGYTEFASVYYRKNANTIRKLGMVNPDNFLLKIGKYLMAERYDIELKEEKCSDNLNEELGKFDAVIAWGNQKGEFIPMDICEDWFDTYQMPLPLAFWACNGDEVDMPLINITRRMADISNKYETLHLENLNESESELIWEWDKDVNTALEQVLQLMYFRQDISDIPAVKVLNAE